MHQADWIPVNYDEKIYDPARYDSWVWELYKPYLIQIVQRLASTGERLKYLDFACGTGRIIAVIESLATESLGVDISQPMLDFASRKVSHTTLRCGDILAQPDLADFDYDLITAFRFFLNTEPEMRTLVMRSLASRLSKADGKLIFNIHSNSWSVDGIKSLYRRLRGWPPVNAMPYSQVHRLVEDAGLEIEAWYGFALWPDRLYLSPAGNICRQVDQWAARIRPLRWISKDMLFVCRRRAKS
ncbi:MAG TPA: class I SAM-dependent methyltransferase [Ktedonobacterales bacterium]